MKRILILVIISTTLLRIALGQGVDENTAATIANSFFKATSGNGRTTNDLKLVYKASSTATDTATSNQTKTYFYVFNASDGFVIVSGSEKAIPILGYSNHGHFDGKNIPPNAVKWLEGYKNEIRYLEALKIEPTKSLLEQWSNLRNGGSSGTYQRTQAIGPLIQTTWDQSSFYNAFCPSNSVTGCVATSMAQIMKFWNYPSIGTGFHSDIDPNFGSLSANFGGTPLVWNSMPNNVTSPNNAVATLMYFCGISVDMRYGAEESLAHTNAIPNALKNYFQYSNTAQYVQRVGHSDSDWIALLKAELDSGRPINYSGAGTHGGHSFVCDGYDNNGFFSFNWGWSGISNGYFALDALNPGTLGIGGGEGGFNAQQGAVIGIQPPSAAITYNLSLYDYVTPLASIISYGQSFSVSTNIYNSGVHDFSGDFCAAVFDANNNFIDYVEIKSGFSLPSGDLYTNDLVFSSIGILGMLPGTYTIGIFYRPTGGDWIQVSNNGGYSNLVQLKVINVNSIQLNSAMAVTPGLKLTQGQPASVNLNIRNDGSSTFTGEYRVGLYKLDGLGTFAQTIGTTINDNNGLPSGYTYNSPYLTFNGSISVDPGSYLLAIEHKPTGGSWQLTGSSYFENPILVTVQAPVLLPDQYEPNNSATQVANLHVNFSDNVAMITTVGANCQVGTDYDYYKVVLPSGYNYSITTKLNDANNSGDGNNYTLDAVFSYSKDGTKWSDAFNSALPDKIQVTGGGTIYFLVSPFFVGQTGTYLLDLSIARTLITGIEDLALSELISIYPNPASRSLTIDARKFSGKVNSVALIDLQGQQLFSRSIDLVDNFLECSVNDLASGMYLIQIETDKGKFFQRIAVNK